MLQNQQNGTRLTAIIKQVKSMYVKQGFNLTALLMDGKFESLQGDLASLNITLNTVASDEHVPEVEQYICTVKERAQCVYNMLPLNKCLQE